MSRYFKDDRGIWRANPNSGQRENLRTFVIRHHGSTKEAGVRNVGELVGVLLDDLPFSREATVLAERLRNMHPAQRQDSRADLWKLRGIKNRLAALAILGKHLGKKGMPMPWPGFPFET